jgi:cytoskeletal protein CcmA (bactofilin family)
MKSPRSESLIGPTVEIKGEINGEEDLRIDGRVEGRINLPQHTVTVGTGGRVQGEIDAKVITVEGKVEGDLRGGERIVISASGRMHGDLATPRVTIEDGARFRGTIDMNSEEAATPPVKAPEAPSRQPAAPKKPPKPGGENLPLEVLRENETP